MKVCINIKVFHFALQMRSSTEGFSWSHHYTLPNSPLPADELGNHEDISIVAIEEKISEYSVVASTGDSHFYRASCVERREEATVISEWTLTDLYNQRPTWLELARKKLDQPIFSAYGWPSDLSDEEILEKLLALNLERAGIWILLSIFKWWKSCGWLRWQIYWARKCCPCGRGESILFFEGEFIRNFHSILPHLFGCITPAVKDRSAATSTGSTCPFFKARGIATRTRRFSNNCHYCSSEFLTKKSIIGHK